jgi:hypothetical protein
MTKVSFKRVITLLLAILLLTMPALAVFKVKGVGTILRVDPPEQEVAVDSFFDVFVYIDSFFDVYMAGIILTYDTTIIDAINVEACSPFMTINSYIADEDGYVMIEEVAEPPIQGSIPLAQFTFKCTGAGESPLIIADYYLFDPLQNPIFVDEIIPGSVTQTSWVFKGSYEDYAPSGVPDFDQKQWGEQMWTNPFPPVGTWSYCGPVAVANSLWWLDSEFEPNPTSPSTINDGFPLVQSYSPEDWDDHDPQNVPYLVEDLAYLMNTNGQRYGTTNCGTEVHEMEMAMNEYLVRQGLDWKFYVHLQKAPDFLWIEEEVKKCQDVVLLLGFWQTADGVNYWRVGGHYVTVAGVDSTYMMLAISDPYLDWAEAGGAGVVSPPPPHPHTGIPETLHNDALYVSHDIYPIGQSPSPGGPFGFYEYPAEYIMDNFGSCQNIPYEFIQLDGEYVQGLPIYTEIEYAVVTSCKTGIVAAGSEDTNVYAWDFYGSLQWSFATGAPVLSVAFDNDANYLVSGSRILSDGPGFLCFFDADLVTGGGINAPLWIMQLPISESYDGSWMGTESKSVDTKYSYYNQQNIVAAATDLGLFLFDQAGNLIWQYYDESPETIVRISQDGNFIVCVDYNTGIIHYFSHLYDGTPGWGSGDGTPVWSFCGDQYGMFAFWVAISGIGDYVAASIYPNPVIYNPMTSGVLLLDRTGNPVWLYALPKGGYVRVDMPCIGNSVVSVNDDPSDSVGCDLNYWSDGGDGWDGGDMNPVWSFSSGIVTDDFYTVSISENGDYVTTGGAPANVYLLQKGGAVQQTMGLMQGAIQSADLTFTGKYGAAVDNTGLIWFFNKDTGVMWAWLDASQAPFHCVTVSKIYPCMFPYPDHNIEITTVATDKDGCHPVPTIGQGYTTNIYVTVFNAGDFAESSQVTVYANNMLIGTAAVKNLASKAQTQLIFQWDTTGLAKGFYTIHVYASIVQDEIDVFDNSGVGSSQVRIVIPGDLNADGIVDLFDAVLLAGAAGATPSSPNWNTNADINNDFIVDLFDAVILAAHAGQTEP